MSHAMLRKLAILASLMLGISAIMTGAAAPAQAQTTFVCPPGYYFLGGYGCYPWGGYGYPAYGPPGYYYAPPPRYFYPPTLGFSFRFGGSDHGHGHGGGHGGHR